MRRVCTSLAEQKALRVSFDSVLLIYRIGWKADSIESYCNCFGLISDLLIDISDVLQICCYELGRTYLKLSQALCINVPSIGEFIAIFPSIFSYLNVNGTPISIKQQFSST